MRKYIHTYRKILFIIFAVILACTAVVSYAAVQDPSVGTEPYEMPNPDSDGIVVTRDTKISWESGRKYINITDITERVSGTALDIYLQGRQLLVTVPQANESGKVKARIENAGTYKGEMLDLLVTFYWANFDLDGKTVRPVIGIYKDAPDGTLGDPNYQNIGFMFAGHSYLVKVDIVKNGTSTPVPCTWTMTMGDIDWLQWYDMTPINGSMTFSTTTDTEMSTKKDGHNGMRVWTDKWKGVSNDRKNSLKATSHDCSSFYFWCGEQVDMSGKVLRNSGTIYDGEKVFTNPSKDAKDKYFATNKTQKRPQWEVEVLARANGWAKVFDGARNGESFRAKVDTPSYSWAFFNSISYGTNLPTIQKRVEQEKLNSDKWGEYNILSQEQEYYRYKLIPNIPANTPENYYDTCVIEDVLPPQCALDQTAGPIKIRNIKYGTDVTDWFTTNYNASTRKLTVTAKPNKVKQAEFYQSLYEIVFYVKRNVPQIFSSPQKTSPEGKTAYYWENETSLTTTFTTSAGSQSHTAQSNKVTTYYTPAKGTVTAQKIDEISGETMTSARFTVYRYSDSAQNYNTSAGTLTYNSATKKYGPLTIQEGPDNMYGMFEIRETTVPAGHTAAPAQRVKVRDGEEVSPTDVFVDKFAPVKVIVDKRSKEQQDLKLHDEVARFYVQDYINSSRTWDWSSAGMHPLTYDASLQAYTTNAVANLSNRANFRLLEVEPPHNYELDPDCQTEEGKGVAAGKTVAILDTFSFDTKKENYSDSVYMAGSAHDHNEHYFKALNPEKGTPARIRILKYANDRNPGDGAIAGVKSWQDSGTYNLSNGKFVVYALDAARSTFNGDGTVNNAVWQTEPVETMTYDSASKMFTTNDLQVYDKAYFTTPGRLRNNGYFKVVEEISPEGFINTGWEKVYHFTMSEDRYTKYQPGNDEQTNVDNTPNIIKIAKVNRNNAPIKNTVFEIGTSYTETDEFTTDDNGIIELRGVKPGTYYFREIRAVKNYKLDPTWHKFEVDKNGRAGDMEARQNDPDFNMITFTLPNDHEQDVEITKTDTDEATRPNGHPFPEGTQFTVYEWTNASNNWKSNPYCLIEYDTDAQAFVNALNGNPVTLTNTPDNSGRFKIIETASTPGYVIDGTPFILTDTPDADAAREGIIRTAPAITLVPEVETLEFTFANEPNEITIEKENPSHEKLDGARFVISAEDVDGYDGDIYTTGTDGDTGEITVKRLPPGTWHFLEISAPDGYDIDDTEYTFIVKEDGTVKKEGETATAKSQTFTVTDLPSVDLKIVKTDSETGTAFGLDSDFPEGTEFDLYEYNADTGKYEYKRHIIYKKEESTP